MPRDKTESGQTAGDQSFVKEQLKAIKEAKKRGDEKEAQRLADQLFIWLGWD